MKKQYWKDIDEFAEDLLCEEENLKEADMPQDMVNDELEEYLEKILEDTDWFFDDESCLKVLTFTSNKHAYQDQEEEIDHLYPYKSLAKAAFKQDILDSWKSISKSDDEED